MKIKSENIKHKVTVINATSRALHFKPNIKEIQKRMVFLMNMVCRFSMELSVRFCDEQEMQKVNCTFRHKNAPTDVLSFPPDPKSSESAQFLGDILVCVPVCTTQARRAHHSLSVELQKMLIHALVHLKGFDHDRNESAEYIMLKLEHALKIILEKQYGPPHLEKETS